MKTIDWRALLCRRLRNEAYSMGCKRIDIRNVRVMKTRPAKIYAVMVADSVMYVVKGCNENEMVACLRGWLAANRAIAPKERIYFN